MPGLLRAVAATAVVSGTATATRNAVNRRQAEKNVAAYSEAQQHVQVEQVAQAPIGTPQGTDRHRARRDPGHTRRGGQPDGQ